MSSIPKSKRTKTEFQIYIDFDNIRHKLYEYIDHDFSNEKCREIEVNGVKQHNDQDWRYFHERELLLKIIDDLQKKLAFGNSIYPTSIHEYYLRREKQTLAIAQLEYLIQELQYIAHDFGINPTKYIKLIPALDKLKAKMKAWRANTKRYKNILPDALCSIIASEVENKDNSSGDDLKVASSSHACNATNNGNANTNNASNALCVCPIFNYLIKSC